jgi:hypothetical protein
MNILGLVQSQKRSVAAAMMPNPLTALRNPRSVCREALASYTPTFANEAFGGRIEELVHPLYILRTGVF